MPESGKSNSRYRIGAVETETSPAKSNKRTMINMKVNNSTHKGPKSATALDLTNAANRLGVRQELLTTVAQVETRGEPFLEDGRVKILFERHIFYRLLKRNGYSDAELRAMSSSNSDIINPNSGGYKGGSAEHDKLKRAIRLNRELAYQSISMGRFQIMGFNFKEAGFKSAEEMFNALNKSESKHYIALVDFIKSQPGMLQALKSKNFDKFAYLYNGKGYRKNNYAVKMHKTYRQLTA